VNIWTILADVGAILTGVSVLPAAAVWLVKQARVWRIAKSRKSELLPGQTLLAGSSLYSPDGRTSLTLYPNGNMVVRVDDYGDFDDTGAMGESSIKCLTLEPDGWLVLYDINGQPVRKWGPGAGHLNVQHNGHVVLYTASDKAIVATDWYLLRGKPTEHGGAELQRSRRAADSRCWRLRGAANISRLGSEICRRLTSRPRGDFSSMQANALGMRRPEPR